jgi:hypothetical protein
MDRVLKKQLKREKSKLLKKRRLSAASITHASKSRKQLEEHRDSPAQMALQAAYEFAGEHEYDLPRAGQALFAYLIHPRTPEEFYKSIHEQTSLLVARKDQPNYYRGLYAHEDLARLPAEAITVSRYVSGERESLAELSAGAFEEGWSIRALRPQAHSDMLWRTCSLLESYWNCNAGANVYWTPAGTQGFAPHYDDVDVFVLQLEGAKRWRVFAPQRDQDTGPVVFPALPRVSSRDFTQSELAQLTLVHDVVLKQGSALYMPRGWVHQAEALPEAASLHVTISMGSQRVTYGDMIERALLAAVKAVRSEGLDSNPGPVDLRRALPRDYASYMGVVHSDQSRDPRRAALEERVTKLIAEHVLPLLPLDAVADDLQAEFLHDRHLPALREGLPPVDESVQVSLDTLVRGAVALLPALVLCALCGQLTCTLPRSHGQRRGAHVHGGRQAHRAVVHAEHARVPRNGRARRGV